MGNYERCRIKCYMITKMEVWINDELVDEIKAFQAKYEFDKEDVNIAGDMFTHKKVTGYNGTGSMTLNKTNSRMIKLLIDYIKEGLEPDITIVGKLADPGNGGSERISLSEVSFDDLTLFDFEVKSLGEYECPFTFTKCTVLDSI